MGQGKPSCVCWQLSSTFPHASTVHRRTTTFPGWPGWPCEIPHQWSTCATLEPGWNQGRKAQGPTTDDQSPRRPTVQAWLERKPQHTVRLDWRQQLSQCFVPLVQGFALHSGFWLLTMMEWCWCLFLQSAGDAITVFSVLALAECCWWCYHCLLCSGSCRMLVVMLSLSSLFWLLQNAGSDAITVFSVLAVAEWWWCYHCLLCSGCYRVVVMLYYIYICL